MTRPMTWWVVAIAAGLGVLAVSVWLTRSSATLARSSERLELEVGRELAQAGVRSGRLLQETMTLERGRGGSYRVVERTYAVPAKFSSEAFVRNLSRRFPDQGFEIQRVERRQAPQGLVTMVDLGVPHRRLYRLTLQEWGPEGVPSSPTGPPSGRPKIAIVLDDWGYSRRLVPEVLKLNRPVTLAILPHQAYSTTIAKDVQGSRCEVILHMPMEPKDAHSAREPQVLTSGMSAEAVRHMLDAALATVPYAKGLSNHQGSKATEDPALMRLVMQDLRRRQLFFLDSFTASRPACEPAAREAGIPFAQRAVFLDNQETPDYIRRQLQELVAAARHTGAAVGIGHDKRVTLEVLQQAMPEMEQEGVEFVALAEVEKAS